MSLAARLLAVLAGSLSLFILAAATMATSGCARGAVSGTRADDDSVARDAKPSVGDESVARDVPAAHGSSGLDDRPAARAQIDDDGSDDPEDPGSGTAPATGHFEKVGTAPLALTRICDLTPFDGALYAAHAHQPLGTDGATITRYRPGEGKPFGVAFDWNRPGEPSKGGGAGQGFLRVRAIGGRLFVADADPPYNGLGLVDSSTEGYVFVSDRAGAFSPPRAPHYRPPAAPDLLDDHGRGGAAVLPRAYHVIDVIKFRGNLYASTGSVPPKERAWHGPSPGALHRAGEDGSRWIYEIDYPYPWKEGVWRLTFMVRFRDRLYAGIQDYDGRDPNDYVYYAPSAAGQGADAGEAGTSSTTMRRDDAHPVRVTRGGAAGTLRWWVDTKAKPARLYWIAWSRGSGVVMRVTSDGDRWAVIPLPDDAGRPTDVARFRDAVVVLAERGLYRLTGSAVDGLAGVDASDGVVTATATPIARVGDGADGGASLAKEKKSPFEVSDFFCAAPLAVLAGELYAGGQRGGALYRLAN